MKKKCQQQSLVRGGGGKGVYGEVRVGFEFFSPLTLFSCAERALSKHNVNCSCASQEMPQLQITDQTKHVCCLALRGINRPPFSPRALTPAATFITGRKIIVSCPLTNTCQFQEKELFFYFGHPLKKYKVFIFTHKKMSKVGLSSLPCLTYVSVFHPVSLFGHRVLPCHSSDSSPRCTNGAEILFVIRYGNSAVISQMMPQHADQTTHRKTTP